MTETVHYQDCLARQRTVWEQKPLLRQVYASFHQRIERLIDPRLPGRILEVGAGIGNLKASLPRVWASDLVPNPWLDLTCDAYELPFSDESVSHLVMVDVFHHLAAPAAFFAEARRVLVPGGRLILLEPYISLSSVPVYGLLHPEPIAWRAPIDLRLAAPRPRAYYAAQGNATRLFFGREQKRNLGWNPIHVEAFASFAYVFSGGFTRPALYPAALYSALVRLDRWLSRWPRVFGARCLVGLERPENAP